MITYEMLLESAVLNDIHKKQDSKISYYTVCQDLRDLCPATSKIVKTIIDFRRQNIIEEKNDNLNNAEIKNSEKTKEIRDEKSKEDKNIVKNDKKENSAETIVKKNKFSFNQNKLINNEKRD